MTTLSVVMTPDFSRLTPSSSEPSVTPVAAKMQSVSRATSCKYLGVGVVCVWVVCVCVVCVCVVCVVCVCVVCVCVCVWVLRATFEA